MIYGWLVLLLCTTLLTFVESNTEKKIFSGKIDIISRSKKDAVDSWINEDKWNKMAPPYKMFSNQSLEFSTQMASNNIQNTKWQQWYILDNLKANDVYEARISYAATAPTDFNLAIFDYEELAQILRSGKRDSLLETEKDEIKVETTTKFLRVRAKYMGVSHIPGRESIPVRFNIVLETLYLGIPYQAYKLVLVIIICCVLGAFVLVPIAQSLISQIREDKRSD
ncbi:hypothetical protein K7432_007400 [Basidiobolus ranarum]|uniref:Uncharacterized protein n=1 Tax=Basidiobolus ranarum TaxID=34480 RepID=A0ABR2WTF3_9FUNG